MRSLSLVLIGLATLAGCSGRRECPSDFAAFGEQEARAGKAASLPGERCEPSADERSAYFKGRAAGLRWYCAGPRLFEEARLGRTPGIMPCPLDLRETALAAQRTGDELFKAQQRRAEADAAAEAHANAQRFVESSEAELQRRVAESDIEQLRGLAITRGWLPNPAVSGTLPNLPPPPLLAAPGLTNASDPAVQAPGTAVDLPPAPRDPD